MAILQLVTAPDPLLKHKSIAVDVIDDAFRKFLDDMVETMYHDNGVGLAAVQVGILKRALVMDLQDSDDVERPEGFYPIKMINPEIILKSEEQCSATEGCLSVPGQFIDVTRPESVTVKFLDHLGSEHVMKSDGWLARVIQHEIDHLDGKTLLNYVSAIKRDVIIRKLARGNK